MLYDNCGSLNDSYFSNAHVTRKGEWEGRYRSTLPNFFPCGRPDSNSPAVLLRGAFRGTARCDGPRTDRSKGNPQSGCSSCDARDAAASLCANSGAALRLFGSASAHRFRTEHLPTLHRRVDDRVAGTGKGGPGARDRHGLWLSDRSARALVEARVFDRDHRCAGEVR